MIPLPPRSTPSIRRRQRQMCIRDRLGADAGPSGRAGAAIEGGAVQRGLDAQPSKTAPSQTPGAPGSAKSRRGGGSAARKARSAARNSTGAAPRKRK
ncbi:hypothetical protein FRIG_04850 [Frigoribacterium faeni]|uniref:hypothetical protein n=1 Tax=Frigoribacterium faeni TaxID=145483 RepID=UPI001FADBC7D|nr:hypothetical protein [Frigoribacterium faeni]MCJ0700465.1 hypothetical protein [Frigoribacterium faeni]